MLIFTVLCKFFMMKHKIFIGLILPGKIQKKKKELDDNDAGKKPDDGTITGQTSHNKQVSEAEILYLLNGIKKGYSYRDFDGQFDKI